MEYQVVLDAPCEEHKDIKDQCYGMLAAFYWLQRKLVNRWLLLNLDRSLIDGVFGVGFFPPKHSVVYFVVVIII